MAGGGNRPDHRDHDRHGGPRRRGTEGVKRGSARECGQAVKAINGRGSSVCRGVRILRTHHGTGRGWPAAAAQATVSAAAIFEVGTDYVVRGGSR